MVCLLVCSYIYKISQFLPKNIQEEIDNLNGLVSIIVKYLSIRKTPGTDDFTGEFCQSFKEGIIHRFYIYSLKN